MSKKKFNKVKVQVTKFLRENRWTLARIGLAAALVVLPNSVSYAQSRTTDDTSNELL